MSMTPELADRLARLNGHQRSLLTRTIQALGEGANDLTEGDFHVLLDELAGIADRVMVCEVMDVMPSMAERRSILLPLIGDHTSVDDVLVQRIPVTALPSNVLARIDAKRARVDRLVAEEIRQHPDMNPYEARLRVEDRHG